MRVNGNRCCGRAVRLAIEHTFCYSEPMSDRIYIAIDLKSFYASSECVDRGLDPLTTNLVVADASRTEKTICLAVSPSLKACGISGRARLFEVVQKVRKVNEDRRRRAPGRVFTGSSSDAGELAANPSLFLEYIIAPPRMARYMKVSAQIYRIYLSYIAPEDIHVYSIDEVFMDVTDYLRTYRMTPRELAMRIILDVLDQTGITATAGIGTNLYLCKVAMDIEAKHIPPDANGVRIAQLDELSYRRSLWSHQPLTDFWRVGRGYVRRLNEVGLHTMGDIARCSLGGARDFYNEDLLYDLFGVNAELLIDHAWGYEPCTMADIKAYRPAAHSMGAGQVLSCPYPYEKSRLVLREMADQLALDLAAKGKVTDQLVLTIGYDSSNLTDPSRSGCYHGPVVRDHYGKPVPKPAHGTAQLPDWTFSSRDIMDGAAGLFDRIADPALLIRRMYLTAGHVLDETDAYPRESFRQLDLFTDYAQEEREAKAREEKRRKEHQLQEAMLQIKSRYGRNAVLRGMNLEDGATARQRNEQIGGHKA